MKVRLSFLCALFLAISFRAFAEEGPAPASDRLTLRQCYDLALKKSEAVMMSGEEIERAEGQYHEVFGNALPAVSFRYSSLWQDRSGLGGLGSVGDSFTLSPQPEASFGLNLPVFTGYREITAVKAGASLVGQRRHERKRAELLLFLDVAKAYYSVLLSEKNLETADKTLKLAESRLKELVVRESLGRSRNAELLDIKARISLLKAEREDARLENATARNLLGFLVGTRDYLLSTDVERPPDPKSLDEYLESAGIRPDARAKKEAVTVAEGVLSTAKADLLPQLDFDANYYVKRSGFREPIDWDVTLGVTVPLWSWGAKMAAVKKAGSDLDLARTGERLTIRTAELEIRDAYERYVSSAKKVSFQKEALGLVRESYLARSDEYRRGLTGNLEVLDTLDRLYGAELSFNAAHFDNVMNYLQLGVSGGVLPGDVK